MFLFIYFIFISQEKKYVFMNLSVSVHKYSLFLLGNISYENTYICTSIHLYYLFI